MKQEASVGMIRQLLIYQEGPWALEGLIDYKGTSCSQKPEMPQKALQNHPRILEMALGFFIQFQV